MSHVSVTATNACPPFAPEASRWHTSAKHDPVSRERGHVHAGHGGAEAQEVQVAV